MRSLLRFLALGGALALAACGVKGPLEPPPGTQAVHTPSTSRHSSTTTDPNAPYTPPRSAADLFNTATPQADWQKKKQPTTGTGGASNLLQGVKRPDQPFILDGLL